MSQASFNPPGAAGQGYTGGTHLTELTSKIRAVESGNSGVNQPQYLTNGGQWMRVNNDGSLTQMIAIDNGVGTIISKEAYSVSLTSGGIGMPVGVVIPYAFDDTPEGYIHCHGQEVSIDDYATLWSKVQQHGVIVANADSGGDNRAKFAYGSASGSFIMPNLKGLYIRNVSDIWTLAAYHGDAIRDLQGSFASIGVGLFDVNAQDGVFKAGSITTTSNPQSTQGTARARNLVFRASYSVPTADENRPVTAIYNYLMKV